MPRTVPDWKKRQQSPVRKIARLLGILVVLGGLGAAGFFGYQQFAATDDVVPTPPSENPDTAIGQATDVVEEINANAGEAEALEQLGLDATGAEGAVQSYAFNWIGPSGDVHTVNSDIATGNFSLTNGTASVRRVGGTYYTQATADSAWLAAELDANLVSVGHDGLLTLESVVPTAVQGYVSLADPVDTSTTKYVFDDARFAAETPELREALLAPWGFTPAEAPTEVGLEITVTVSDTGDVVEAIVTSPSIGGTATYSLTAAFPSALIVEVPPTS